MDQRLVYSLDGRVKLASEAIQNLGLRRCLSCYAMVHSQAEVCEHCGAAFEAKSRNLKVVDGELVEIVEKPAIDINQRVTFWIQALDECHETRRMKTEAIRWYRKRFDAWPVPPLKDGAAFGESIVATAEIRIWAWARLTEHARTLRYDKRGYPVPTKSTAHKSFLTGWCNEHYKRIFGFWAKADIVARGHAAARPPRTNSDQRVHMA